MYAYLLPCNNGTFNSFLINFSAFSLAMFQNELAILEFIHLLVETMDRHFGNVVSYWSEKKKRHQRIVLYQLSKVIWVLIFAVWAGHHVSFGESTLHAGGNGHEWLYCWDQQGQHPLSNTANGQSIIGCLTLIHSKVLDIRLAGCVFIL